MYAIITVAKVGKIKMIEKCHDTIREFSRYVKDNDPIGINFVGKSVCDQSFCVEREHSNIMSLEYIVEGEGVLKINGQTLYPSGGDIFLLTEGSNHRYFCQKENPWRKYFISFKGPLANKLRELYLPINTYLFKDCDLKENFENIFKSAFDDSKSYETILSEITVELVKIMIYIRSKSKPESIDLADLIKGKIDCCIDKEFSLEEIADSLNYTKNHIINIFKAKYNKTPYQYYMDTKIISAKRYLQQTNCAVADIASNLAFSDAQYFSYFFKRATGLSPSEYRRQFKS